MSFSLVPDYSFGRLTDISPEFFVEHGISLVLLDLDNTIAPYGQEVPSDEMILWVDKLREYDITAFIVSNSKKPHRVNKYSEVLNVGFIKAAGKPSPKAVKMAAEMLNKSADESVLIGDQIFTDVLAANNADMMSIVLYPIKFTNVFLRIRYWLEIPFRAMCNHKMEARKLGKQL